MKKTFNAAIRRTVIAVAAAGFSHFAVAQTPDFLVQHGLSGKSVEQMVEAIDQSPQSRPLPYSASITSAELKLSDGQREYVYPLGDRFYLSFAPYISQTHPCFNHSLSGCRGELANTAFEVKITDRSGKVLIQDRVTSYQNGFVGVWLPRNTAGTIEVKYQGKTATAPFATDAESQTCMTTLQLQNKA